MSVQLRIVLDQAAQVVDADQARAAMDLASGLIQTAPRGCAVSAIVPSGAEVQLPGLQDVRTLPLARRELAATWQLGIAPGVGGGLIHAPSLMAPLVRHDRVHDNDQTTVTLWDLCSWQAPESLPKTIVAWQKAMLKRAVKHADAVVVPSHAMAVELAEFARLGDRLRVIAGAAPRGFAAPDDVERRRQVLRLPDRYIVVTGQGDSLVDGFRAAAQAGVEAVVLGVAEGGEGDVLDAASAAGLAADSAHVRGELGDADRATVICEAGALVATSTLSAWPWRAVEAMSLGVPLVAVDCGVHRDVIADGGVVVDATELGDALVDVLGDAAKRARVLAADRARAFSWGSAAERIWALHADL